MHAVDFTTHFDLDKSVRPLGQLHGRSVNPEEMEPEVEEDGSVEDFTYLVDTDHVDNTDGMLYRTTRVDIYKKSHLGPVMCAWRKRVLPGGVLNSFEEGPFHVRDIALYTEQMESSVFTSPMLPEESLHAFDSVPSSDIVPPYEKDLPRLADQGEEPKTPTSAPHSPTSSRKRNRDMLGRSINDKRVTFAPPRCQVCRRYL